MDDTHIILTLQEKEITLIGTAHVSKESIEEVSRIIRENRPDMVCVELDAGRYKSISERDHWEKLDVARVFKEGKGFLLIANLVLSSFQRRLGADLGVKPGEEMKIAVETAEALGIPYAFCDREVQLTLHRAWARCSLWSKCKLLGTLLSSAFSSEKLSEAEIESLKNRNELDGMMTELSNYLPEVKETLIDERDRYLAAKIWTSEAPASPEKEPAPLRKYVAVVGAGHLLGIAEHLERIAAKEAEPDVSALDTLPPKGIFATLGGLIIPALIIALAAAGFFRADARMSLDMLLHWILLNGSLAALGTLIALGHPLSILVSFFGAPIATINPLVSVGLFSGITEVTLRKPRVLDTETISDDITSLRGIYRNRITRALLVFFLSSLGGAIGNFISIPSLARFLVK